MFPNRRYFENALAVSGALPLHAADFLRGAVRGLRLPNSATMAKRPGGGFRRGAFVFLEISRQFPSPL